MYKSSKEAMNLPSFDQVPTAVAIDLDGTLLNSLMQLSERNRVAIERCITQGVPVVIATSRPTRTVRRLLGDELMKSCSLIVMNGAVAMAAPPLFGLVREALPTAVAEDIVELTLSIEPRAHLVVELDGYEFGTNVQLGPETLWKTNSATSEMVLSLKQALARIPTKVAVDGLGHDLSVVAGKLSQLFGDLVSIIPSDGTKFLNIISMRASKANALRQLIRPQKVPMANVIAFGNDIPDIGMLAMCCISIAVANSVSEVLAVTNYRTASNDDDGVAIVLERMLRTVEK